MSISKSLTLVTLDTTAAQFPRLQRLTLELEDCLGSGTLQLLTQLGSQLLEVSISCSSDPDAAPPLEDELTGPSVQVRAVNVILRNFHNSWRVEAAPTRDFMP